MVALTVSDLRRKLTMIIVTVYFPAGVFGCDHSLEFPQLAEISATRPSHVVGVTV